MIEYNASHDIILSFIDTLENGAQLSGSARRYKLLRYLVTAELAGKGADLKAYAIGLDVLKRPEDFDPSTDSIVRVEVARLRDALELYYAKNESLAVPRISIPRGTYRPKISIISTTKTNRSKRKIASILVLAAFSSFVICAALIQLGSAAKSKPQTLFTGPSVATLPFDYSGDATDAEDFAYGLGIDLITEVSRFDWLSVFMVLERPKSLENIGEVDYILTGDVRTNSQNFLATITLLEAGTGKVLWSEKYSKPRNAVNLLSVQHDAAIQIAGEIARPEGLISSLESRKIVRDVTQSDSAYACIFMLYKYWRDFSETTHLEVRSCLEDSLIDEPNYAEAHGALSFMFIDEGRKQYNMRPGYNPWERALFHAKKGYALNPNSSIAAQALFTYYSRFQDLENFRRIGDAALKNSPNNPEILADYGNKLAINLGLLSEGAGFAQRAINLNPNSAGWYYISPAIQSYSEGLYEQGFSYAQKIRYVNPIYSYAVAISSAVRLGDKATYLEEMAAFDSHLGMNFDETIAYLRDVWPTHRMIASFERDLAIAFEAYALHQL
jgi:TolB-like protein